MTYLHTGVKTKIPVITCFFTPLWNDVCFTFLKGLCLIDTLLFVIYSCFSIYVLMRTFQSPIIQLHSIHFSDKLYVPKCTVFLQNIANTILSFVIESCYIKGQSKSGKVYVASTVVPLNVRKITSTSLHYMLLSMILLYIFSVKISLYICDASFFLFHESYWIGVYCITMQELIFKLAFLFLFFVLSASTQSEGILWGYVIYTYTSNSFYLF